MEQSFNTLLVELQQGVLTVTLNRPEKRNAMNMEMVQELFTVFEDISRKREIRAVVIRGSQGNFCAGGDISDMGEASQSESAKHRIWRFNRSFGHLISAVNSAPQVVITLCEGAVLGGGFGLACVSDVGIVENKAMFAMPETGLGVVPAQIAPFVVKRIGLTQARRLALLGERINGHQAVELGIAHFVVESSEEMQNKLDDVIKKLKRCAPEATAITKTLMLEVGTMGLETLLDRAADSFTDALNSDEGREGTNAFIEKRKPSWCE